MPATFQAPDSGCLPGRTGLSRCNTECMNMDHNVIGECRYAYASNAPFVDFERTVIFVSAWPVPLECNTVCTSNNHFIDFEWKVSCRALTFPVTRIVPLFHYFCVIFCWTSFRPEYSSNICLLDVKQPTAHQKEMTTNLDSI